MGKEYTAKSFKSGNSVAIRLPKELGIEPGREYRAEEVDGELRLRIVQPPAEKIDLTGVYGSMPGLKVLKPEDRIIEGRELDWTGERLKRG